MKNTITTILALLSLVSYGNCPDSTSKSNDTAYFYYLTAISPAPTELELTLNGVVTTYTTITTSTYGSYTVYAIVTQKDEYDVAKWYGLNKANNKRVVASCSTSSALPVTFIDQKASLTSRYVIIEWSTAMELNNHYFEIEKYSQDGFKPIGRVGGNGTTNEISNYLFHDYNVDGINIYRIKQVDYDGKFDYSDMFYVHKNVQPTENVLEGITLIGQRL